MMSASVDVVVCVYNGLQHVRQCLRSLQQHTSPPYHLVVVDDGSHEHVASEVQAILATGWSDGTCTYLRHDENLGYLRSVNDGVAAGSGELVVLLNSDTLVAPGWLEGLTACVTSAHDVAIACPVSNHANFTRVPFPDGSTFLDMAAIVRAASRRAYPEIGLASGFCFAARRSLYDRIGVFDEVYGRGYYEESDLCMRASEQGLRVVGDDATFVYHHGWGSFGGEGRNQWMEENRKVFERRWGRAHDYWRERYLEDRPFAYLEDAVTDALAVRASRRQRATARWSQIARRRRASDHDEGNGPTTYRQRKPGDWRRLAEEVQAPGAPSAPPAPTAPSRDGGRDGGGTPRVLYLLPGLGPYGGVLSVAQLVNRLLLRGLHAQIATCGRVDEGFYREQLFFRPYVYGSSRELLASLPRYDLVVATRWDTVYDALLLAQRWGCKLASFVQDLEFDQEPDGERAAASRLALELVHHKIVKSEWLEGELAPFGGTVHRIPLGLNRDIFYPAGLPPSRRPLRVVSAARPGVAHRNLDGTVEIFRRLAERRDDVLPTFFGRTFEVDGLDYDHHGPLNQQEVAALLRDSAVLLDASRFQGFGRPGLEAMACGVPAVLTTEGGINQYARHEHNCLQVDPTDVAANVAAIERLLDDTELAVRLRHEGFATAARFDAEVEADRTAAHFLELIGSAASPEAALAGIAGTAVRPLPDRGRP